jgi:hypothetical protein
LDSDERAFLRESIDAPQELFLPPPARLGKMRLIVIVLAVSGALFACGFGISYLAASRSASRAALRIAPDLGPVDSDFGFHPESTGGDSRLGWEFDYGPSGAMGPITLQFYMGFMGRIYRTEPPEAMERLTD